MNFDPVAPYYSALELVFAFGQLQRARLAMLHELEDSKHVLMIGEGQGRCLIPLLKKHPQIQVTCLDGSEAMLKRASIRLQSEGLQDRCELKVMDVLSWQPDDVLSESYDAIVTHFFFDCFKPQEQAAMIRRLATLLKPSGIWLIADFTEPPKGWRGTPSRLLLGLLYEFFQRTTGVKAAQLTAPDPWLINAGFNKMQQKSLCLGLLQSDLWIKKANQR